MTHLFVVFHFILIKMINDSKKKSFVKVHSWQLLCLRSEPDVSPGLCHSLFLKPTYSFIHEVFCQRKQTLFFLICPSSLYQSPILVFPSVWIFHQLRMHSCASLPQRYIIQSSSPQIKPRGILLPHWCPLCPLKPPHRDPPLLSLAVYGTASVFNSLTVIFLNKRIMAERLGEVFLVFITLGGTIKRGAVIRELMAIRRGRSSLPSWRTFWETLGGTPALITIISPMCVWESVCAV